MFGTLFIFAVMVLELAKLAVRLGKSFHIEEGPVLFDVTIGNNCKIQNNVSVYDAVVLEDDVFCGPSMVFTKRSW